MADSTSFAALSGLWKFRDKDYTVPDRRVLKRLPLIDFAICRSMRGGAAFLKRKGMRVNLGGIGRNATDRAVNPSRRGCDFMIRRAVISTRPAARRSIVARRHPIPRGHRSFAALDLSDGTFSPPATERCFIKDGAVPHPGSVVGERPGAAA
jgi:hypothetical protein